ncbi:MAG: DnaJ domain-containing protein [Helicobacteraceae bacterium]|jgi:hypothetical protein|nr:DnaJ domain-containing protein [Helicobacteraceae bacterium]
MLEQMVSQPLNGDFDMTITLHAREIRVLVLEGSINHLILKNFIARYFSNVLKLRDALIIMHEERELSQKKYFIQWLYAAYQKKRADITPKFLKALQSAIAFPITVKVISAQKTVQGISVRIKVPQSNHAIFSLSVEPEGSLAVNFFRFRFQPHITRQAGAAEFYIENSQESLKILTELLSRDRILAMPVSYVYDKSSIAALFASLNSQKEREKSYEKQKFYRIIIEEDNKLREAYKLLGASESFDDAALKRAYREMASRHHPDRAYANGERAVAEMTRKFHAINDAYALIVSSRS